MRIVEGTPQEIVEYERLTGATLHATPAGDATAPREETADTDTAGEVAASGTSASLSPQDHVSLMKFIYGRAGKNDLRTFLAERFIMRLLDEQDIAVAFGRSSKTLDGLADYLMIRDNGPQRYGAVAYLRPSNGGLTVRLGPDDIEGIGEKDNVLIQYRNVAPTDPYKINCPLADDAALELALALVRAALNIVRAE
ncbi:hypothetical protein ACFYYB_41330 [Streptomyces sp. NPDC002886]|uniref:hypothetical protein n=1 Tax=Streptomyces sp. NPDC002886 TaxID=3364667 RepID=UPI0036B9107A